MGCGPCIDTVAVLQLLETLINKMLASGQLQPGLRDCDERRLGQDVEVVACAQLATEVQKFIDDGTLKFPEDVHVGAVSFVDNHIVLRLTDGTIVRSETEIPEQVHPTAVTVDGENYIIITMSDGTTLRSATPVETPEPVEVTEVSVDGDNHIVIALSDGTTLRTATAVETPPPVEVTDVAVDGDNHIVVTLSDGTTLRTATPVETPEPVKITDVDITTERRVVLTTSTGELIISDSQIPEAEMGSVVVDTDNYITVALANGSTARSASPVNTVTVMEVVVDGDNHIVLITNDGEQIRSATAVETPPAVTVVAVALDGDDHVVLTLSDGTTIRSETSFDTTCTFLDCDGEPLKRCAAIATCEDLRKIVPLGGTVGQVLTRTATGTEWDDKLKLVDCNGDSLPDGTKIPTCEQMNEAVDNVLPEGGTEGAVLTYKVTGVEWVTTVQPKMGEGVIYDEATDTVSVDVDWLRRQIADLICPQSECQTWYYNTSKSHVPVLNSTSIYYVEITSGDGTKKTIWFGNGDEVCYRYSTVIPGDGSAQFELYVGEEQTQLQIVTGTGSVEPNVVVYRLTLVTEVTEAGTSVYADGAPGTVNETPTLNGVTVQPANRVFPGTGTVSSNRPNDRRWFYLCNLSTTLPPDTYYIYAQADDSITLQLADVVSSHDFTGCWENCTRSATFSVTTSKSTSTLYVDNHNNNLQGGESPSWFALTIVNSAGSIVFNGVDPENKWLVTETTYGCDETST